MIDAVVLLLTLACLLPVGVFALQVFAAGPGVLSWPADAENPGWLNGKNIAVLVPAHNEALVIGATLAGIREQIRAEDRLVVVADNCDDSTAEIARKLGAEVVERTDPALRGKGYALAYGVRHLQQGPAPSVVVIVDADCQLAAGALALLCRHACDTDRPVQALYLMHAAADAGARQNVSVFAWRVKNWLRPKGASRMGWPCMLTGSGMAFPWPLIKSANLAHGSIVEDMQLGLDLAMQGAAPVFLEAALVTSTLASNHKAETAQRNRWERGHLGQIIANGPALAISALRTRDLKQLWLLLDLIVPPLSLLATLVLTLMTVVGVLVGVGIASPALLVPAATTVALLVAAVHGAWRRCGADLIPARDLPTLLTYAALKLPRYVAMLAQRSPAWTKTRRDV